VLDEDALFSASIAYSVIRSASRTARISACSSMRIESMLLAEWIRSTRAMSSCSNSSRRCRT